VQATTAEPPGEPRQRGRVLVVEDNAFNMAVLSTMLDNLGYTVEEAEDGVQALVKATDDSNLYRLILMDCEMPHMDGYEATRQLRSRGLDTPIIAVTAHAMEENRQLCLQVGMNDVLTKPVIFDALREKVEEWTAPSLDEEQDHESSARS
jgi:CheY-like chemotaxis protein